MKEKLQAIYSLLENEKRWTTHAEARDAAGELVDPKSEKAVCWCLLGAIRKVSNTTDERVALLVVLDNRLGQSLMTLALFNDFSTHQDILQLIKGAME